MSRGAKILVEVLVTLVSVPLFFLILLLAMFYVMHLTIPMCSFPVLSESASPGGSYTAVMSEGSCGATTPFTTRVSAKSEQSEEVVLSYAGELELSLRWMSPTKLLVANQTEEVSGQIRIYVKKDHHEGLSIDYEGFQDGWLRENQADFKYFMREYETN